MRFLYIDLHKTPLPLKVEILSYPCEFNYFERSSDANINKEIQTEPCLGKALPTQTEPSDMGYDIDDSNYLSQFPQIGYAIWSS